MIGTCVLLLNAGHEATVHSLGNAVKALVDYGPSAALRDPERCVEEVLRFDPPLHMFTRHVYAPIEVGGHRLGPGDEIALMLGAAGRDPAVFERPDQFDPTRVKNVHVAFGGGLHFCVGAPLARLEMQIALPMLFQALPDLKITEPPAYADSYHFHKLDRLIVTP